MKKILLFSTVFCFQVSAFQCEDFLGDEHWINPTNYQLDTSILSPGFGGDCETQIVSNPIVNSFEPELGFAYMEPDLIELNGRVIQDFSIDFAEVLSGNKQGNWVKFFVLNMAGNSGGKAQPEIAESLHMIIEKINPPTFADTSYWKVTLVWSDTTNSTSPVAEDVIYIDNQVSSGLLEFSVSWTENSNQGGMTSVTVNSSLIGSLGPGFINFDLNEPNSFQGQNLQSFYSFRSPYNTVDQVPHDLGVGIIESNTPLPTGTGLTIYTPY